MILKESRAPKTCLLRFLFLSYQKNDYTPSLKRNATFLNGFFLGPGVRNIGIHSSPKERQLQQCFETECTKKKDCQSPSRHSSFLVRQWWRRIFCDSRLESADSWSHLKALTLHCKMDVLDKAVYYMMYSAVLGLRCYSVTLQSHFCLYIQMKYFTLVCIMLNPDMIHSHKILTIEQGEPCYLSIWSNPCRLHKECQAGRASVPRPLSPSKTLS